MALIILSINAGKKYFRFSELVKKGDKAPAIIKMIRPTVKPIITSLKFNLLRF